ncbi:hypothetical protein GTO89_06165 [Heliobacterium gestii]|uniref:Uncharacterized protein n=1 Tax=Heliomicrobium gestii TaxID=2699 RepID=A0A845L7N5_HELGE|nr:hypothetical protein [Heliomicrobium gestii]MBM7866048.1 hypothetical protein [Heliomicrobium gestii]MZP42622.1 hypothetical protein [Heliomicrobium gestii]
MSLFEKLRKLRIGSSKYRQRQVEQRFPICYCQSPSPEAMEWLLQDLQQQRNELVDYDLLGDPFFSMVLYRFLTPGDKERLPTIDSLIAAILERRAFDHDELFRLNGLYGYTLPKAAYPVCPVVLPDTAGTEATRVGLPAETVTPAAPGAAAPAPTGTTDGEPSPVTEEPEPERLRVFRF